MQCELLQPDPRLELDLYGISGETVCPDRASGAGRGAIRPRGTGTGARRCTALRPGIERPLCASWRTWGAPATPRARRAAPPCTLPQSRYPAAFDDFQQRMRSPAEHWCLCPL